MRALFINVGHGRYGVDEHPRHDVAPMDLAQCAAILEEDGWRVELWDTATEPATDNRDIIRRVVAKKPDLLVVRPLHPTLETCVTLLRAVEAEATMRIALGPQASTSANRLIEEGRCQGVLLGEPEGTFLDLRHWFRRGRLPKTRLAGLQTEVGNPVLGRPLLTDLDSLPLPAQHLLALQGYRFRYPLDVQGPLKIGYVLTSRGCALRCVFCSPVERETVGRKYRWRSPDHICDELESCLELGVNGVYFIDDFFGFSASRIEALCERMIARGVTLPWAAQVRAHGLPLALLQLMREAGCSTLCFGAESGSNRVLKSLKKGVTVAQIRDQAALIRQAGIQSVAYFIVGAPSETPAERQATYSLIEEISPDVVQIHIYNVFPGAPAMDQPGTHYDPLASKFTGPSDSASQQAGLSQRLHEERQAFYRRYYLHPAYITRTLKRRWRPMLANLSEESQFAWRSARFFFSGASR